MLLLTRKVSNYKLRCLFAHVCIVIEVVITFPSLDHVSKSLPRQKTLLISRLKKYQLPATDKNAIIGFSSLFASVHSQLFNKHTLYVRV